MLERVRWVPIGFLFAGGMINYMDRAALSVAAPLIIRDLRLDPAQLGVIFSSFFAGYALFTFVGGYAADVLGPKRVFILSMTLWSAFCGLTAAAVGFASLIVVRILFGFGEGPFSAAANKMVGNWFPPRQIATAVGLANAGTPIGGALAGPVAGWLALRYGWRVSFVALAGIGFVWTLLWATFVRDRPHNEVDVTEPEAAGANHIAPPLVFYLRHPTVIATAVSFFGYGYILFFFLSWFPSYLTMAQHVSIRDMGFLNTIPWMLGTIGLASSGLLCDLLSRMTGDALRARRLVLVICLVVAALCVALTGLVSSLAWAVGLMTTAIFFIYLTGATYWAIIQGVVDREHVGTVSGFVHLIANCSGIIGPAGTGFIVKATGAFTSAFLLAGGIALFGSLLVATSIGRPKT